MNKKICIMHIAQSAGGVDRYIRMLIKYMNSDKFKHILVCSYDFREQDYMDLVIGFIQVKMERKIEIHDVNTILAVRKLIQKYKPDIVYAHSSKAGAIARIADIGMHNTCVYNPHGWAFNMRCSVKKQKIYTVIEKLAAYFCKKIICISEAERESALARRVCSDRKLQVIFNGIDIDEYEKYPHNEIVRGALGIQETAFIVGMVGRISTQKAPDIFIRVAEKLKKEIPEAYFIIVGNGEQEDVIRKYAEKNNLEDSLLITGWVENPMSYIELFDVALLLSRWEGFGLVLPEYMLAEKPIVASRIDAIPNIITDRENGLLVEVDDVDDTYNAVMEIFLNNKLKEQLIQRALADVHRKFNAKRVAKEHEIMFEEFIE